MGKADLQDTTIQFWGENNILFFEDGVTLKKSKISFSGDDSVIFIRKNAISVSLEVAHNSAIYIGEKLYTNSTVRILATERKHVCIGDDCLFSFGILFRTADPHLVYDASTYTRINTSKSIFIGDHVWIGENVLLLKGTSIGSGSIIGANSVVANKKILSNCAYAGNPAQKVRSNVFFHKPSTHNYLESNSLKSEVFITDLYTYSKDEPSNYFNILDEALSLSSSAKERMETIQSMIVCCTDKNRFTISPLTA